ncbi:C-C motif chemokine 4-like [Scomber japonicus]|uniref:C-C motif chemokine 4-like n=1 Tax=Scomber japonicus TaxID=13676 RepID=UPI0023054B79|nr:C-C motif chemokine 4-like [Scomber japonicus]
MKTLTFTVGLLLLLTVYCTAMPHAVNEITPELCCFKFFLGAIPRKEILSIVKTDSRCRNKAFVISAANGKDMCVSQDVRWAKAAFRRQQAIKPE